MNQAEYDSVVANMRTTVSCRRGGGCVCVGGGGGGGQ
jgi:hypothetical protein